MMLYPGTVLLHAGDPFPDPLNGPKDEPVAIGLELSPELMLAGYCKGLFAWSVNPVTWWSPDPRAIFELDGFRVSKSLRKKIKRRAFRVTMDEAFVDVVAGCAQTRTSGQRTWVTREFRRAFRELHEMGYAHSVESWQGGELVGGVLGVAIHGFFSAETMFSRATDASKIALYDLLETLRATGFVLFDIQELSPHTASLGAIEISRAEYLARLERALQVQVQPLGKREIAAADI
jgi:leucyl/phenylalanyl-tRNA--protein transferase